MKQNEETLCNYTVAKITCDCNFSLTKIVKQKVKILTTSDTKELIFDNNGDVQFENDLDENNNQQLDFQYETRFLLPNGTQITETEYTTKILNSEECFIACFVGCTYHCG